MKRISRHLLCALLLRAPPPLAAEQETCDQDGVLQTAEVFFGEGAE